MFGTVRGDLFYCIFRNILGFLKKCGVWTTWLISCKPEFTMGSKVQTDFEWYNPENNLEKKNKKIEAA